MFVLPLGSQSLVIKSITLSADQTDWNLITDGFGGVAPTRQTTLTLTIDAGVDLIASTNLIAALDLTGLPAGSTIALINNGNVFGTGGDGGDGEGQEIEFSDPCLAISTPSTVGAVGGPAIVYDGTGVDLAITNASGRIWAGGGGGGGGGACNTLAYPACSGNAGGGGGGGAGGSSVSGFGAGGDGGTQIPGAGGPRDGSDGSAGTGDTGGSGGSGGLGGTGLPSCSSGVGGAGGNFGAAGSIGTVGGASAGGDPGLAIDNNGTGSTSWTSGGVQGVDLIGVAE